MRLSYLIGLALLVGGLSFGTYWIALGQFEKEARLVSKDRVELYRASLRSTLQRVSHLPRVVVLHPETREALVSGKPASKYNRFLKSINEEAGSAALYLLDSSGTTIASSNFDTSESFVGSNYRFRKYFQEALNNGKGRFFAVGVTTGRPGFFYAERISEDQAALGVAVVKVEFANLLSDWQKAGENILITNADGIVVLASQPEWLYKAIRNPTPGMLARIRASRQFAGYEITKLDFDSASGEFSDRLSTAGENLLVTTSFLPDLQWTVHHLAPLASARASAIATGVVVFLLCGLTLIGFLYARSRVERTRLRIVAIEAERVRQANKQLESEITDRKNAEKQLRQTQAELIQSSRLAALGKMSAAIVHEVNQPVSAIRTFTSSGQLLLKEKRHDEAVSVFRQIRDLTERLGAITTDLLVFSRKPVAQTEPVEINQCIKAIVAEKQLQIPSDGPDIQIDLWKGRLPVVASKHRVEQLISNIVQNAVQACEQSLNPQVNVTTLATPGSMTMMVSDNGDGFPEEMADQLFDPFFTTKEIGKGVGLGLALAYAIVDEIGGKIRCENRPEGGAIFIVELPLKKRASRTRKTENAKS